MVGDQLILLAWNMIFLISLCVDSWHLGLCQPSNQVVRCSSTLCDMLEGYHGMAFIREVQRSVHRQDWRYTFFVGKDVLGVFKLFKYNIMFSCHQHHPLMRIFSPICKVWLKTEILLEWCLDVVQKSYTPSITNYNVNESLDDFTKL
mgnify:FL=1